MRHTVSASTCKLIPLPVFHFRMKNPMRHWSPCVSRSGKRLCNTLF
jgi:hypothetical protein